MNSFKTIFFVIITCFVAASILTALELSLQERKRVEKLFDQKKQRLLAAKIINYKSSLQLKDGNHYSPARFDKATDSLLKASHYEKADKKEIGYVADAMISAILVDKDGNIVSYKEAGLEEDLYLEFIKKRSFEDLLYFPIFIIKNGATTIGYVIPIQGFGLWSYLYGYIAIEANGHTVISTTWYQQEETAGLGADIALPYFQKQFENKDIFLPDDDGSIDPKRAPIGIMVVKGGVKNRFGTKKQAINAVDAISGASFTSNGVALAYTTCLEMYRPFLIKIFTP